MKATFTPAFVGAVEADPPSDGETVKVGAVLKFQFVLLPLFVELETTTAVPPPALE